MDTSLDLTPAAVAPTSDQRHFGLLHRVISWVLVVLVAVLMPLSVVSVWSVRTVTDTNRYVSTMAPLIENPAVQTYLATEATDQLFKAVDVQGYFESKVFVPAIATLLTNELRTFTIKAVDGIISTPQFTTIWDAENRFTHALAIKVLSGDATSATDHAQALEVKLQALVLKAITVLAQHHVTLFNPIVQYVKAHGAGNVVIATGRQLSQAQKIFRLVNELKWLLPISTVVLAAVALLIGPHRRKVLLRLLVGSFVAMVLLAVGLRIGRGVFVAHALSDPAAAAAIWQILLRYLRDAITSMLWLLGVGIAVTWLTGPSRAATWLRASARRGAGAIGKDLKTAAGSRTATTAADTAAANLALLRAGGSIVAMVVLLVWVNSTIGTVLTLLALVAYLAGLQVLAARVAPPKAALAPAGATAALATTPAEEESAHRPEQG